MQNLKRSTGPRAPLTIAVPAPSAEGPVAPAPAARHELISPERLPLRRAEPPPPPQAPVPSTGIAGLEVRETPPTGAAEARKAEVSISEKPVREELEATLAEAERLHQDLKADAHQWLKELPALKDTPGYDVRLGESGGDKIAEARRLGPNGRIEEQVRLTVGSDGKIKLSELVHHDDRWLLTERETGTDQEGRSTLRVQSSIFLGGVSPLEEHLLRHAKRLELAEVESTLGDGFVERVERTTYNADGKGRRDRVDESKLSFKTYPGVHVRLDGKAEKAFRLDDEVIERHAHVTTKHRGERTVTSLLETAYCQGNVRAVEAHEGAKPVLLVEKEVEPGVKKETQLFRRGTEETVRTTTTVVGDEVRTKSVVWDSNGQPVGPESSKPKKLKTIDGVRRFGASGELCFDQQTSVDLETGEHRTETFRRAREGDRAVETVTLDKTVGDQTTRSTARRVDLISKDGDVPLSVETEGDGNKVALTVTDHGLEYTTTLKDGSKRHGVLQPRPGVGDFVLKLNGKEVDIPGDPKQAAKLLKKHYSDSDLAGFDLALSELGRPSVALRVLKGSIPGVAVQTGVNGVLNYMSAHPTTKDSIDFALGEYGRLGSVMDRIQDPSVRQVSFDRAPIPGLLGQLSNAIGFVGVGFDAMSVMDHVKKREYFKASTGALRTGERAFEYGGYAFGVLGAATPVGIAMRAGRAGVDVVEGTYNTFKGDTRWDRMRGAASVGSAGVRVGLALTIGAGPLSPFLFAGLAVTEAAAFAFRVADNHYVAPMSKELEADPKPAPLVTDALREQLAKDRKEVIGEAQKKTPEEIAAAKLVPGDLTKKKGGTHLKFEVKDEDGKKYTFKPFEPGDVGFERDVMANAMRSAAGEASAEPVKQTVTLPSGQTVEGYVKPHVKEKDDAKFGGDPTKWTKAEVREVLADAPWAELLGNYDLKLDQYTALDDSKPEKVVDRDWDASLSDFKRNDPLDRHKAFKAGFIAEKLGLAAPPAQALLYEAYVKGRIELDFAPMFEAIERIQALSDDEIRADMAPFLAKAFAEGKTFAPFKTADEVVAAVLDRKAHLKESFEKLVQLLDDERVGLAHDKGGLIPSPREVHAWSSDLKMHIGEWFVESPLLKMVNQHMQKKEAKRLGIKLTP